MIRKYALRFTILALVSICISQSQAQEFNVMGKKYRFTDGKWSTFFNNKQGAEIIPDQVLVRAKDRRKITVSDFKRLGIDGIDRLSTRFAKGFYVVSVSEVYDPFLIAGKLEATNLFDIVEFDFYGEATAQISDPLYSNQWNLYSDKLNMEKAWNLTTGNSAIIVAIIDGGVMYNHEDLSGNIWVNPSEDINGNGQPDYWPSSQGGDQDGIDNDGNNFVDDLAGWNFVDGNNTIPDESHGTRVAGVVAARTNNNKGVAGIAGGWDNNKGVRLMLLRDAIDGQLYVSKMAMAIDYARQNGARVINISQKYDKNSPNPAVDKAISDAGDADIVIIASAGNRGGDQVSNKVMDFPARNYKVISAGSTDQNDERWRTSDQDGSQIGGGIDMPLDVMAPAPSSSIWTTQSGAVNNYTSAFGKTSAAAAEVSGLAGLIRSINPSLTRMQVRTILRNTADKVNGPAYTDEYGYGRINAYTALLEAAKKSLNSDATASNSGRRLVRDGSGNYHLVFGSKGEVFLSQSCRNRLAGSTTVKQQQCQ